MRFITTTCSVILLLSICILRGQYKPKIWDTRDGLSNNWVSDITQDDKGYIWLATQYGLNRFDGYSFESFTHNPEDSNSPIANWVKRIVKKTGNELWLGVDYGGLNLYDIKKHKFDHYAIVHQNDTITSINKLLTSAKNFLYIATNSGLFRKTADQKGVIKIYDGKVIDLIKNAKGEIFFLSASGMFTYDIQKSSYEKVIDNSSERIKNIFIDSEDRLFGLADRRLLAFQYSNGAYTISKRLEIDRLVSLLFADSPIIEDSEKRIWIGGDKGISIVDKNRNATEFYPYVNLFEKDLGPVQALSFFEDMHKNMWIGTNKGLALVSTFTKRFQSNEILTLDENLNDVREFNQVNNKLLIASNEGLFYVDDQRQAKNILKKKIYGMRASESGSLFAIGNGLYEIDTTSFKVKVLSASDFKRGWSITEDKTGNLWMIADGKLFCYHKDLNILEKFDTEKVPTLKDSPRIGLLIDSKGRLWICTLRSGVYILENPEALKLGETPKFRNINYISGNVKSLSHHLATSLLEASDDTIWIGTDAGLNAVDPKTLEVKRYLKKDGLKDEKIMALLEDDFGNIWGSTVGNGIFQFDEASGTFNFFGQEDGLRSNNFLLSSAFKSKDGILFFGTDNGIQVVDPVAFNDFVRPKIDFFFTSAQLPSQASDGQIRRFDAQPKEIVFDHDDNSFTINYTTLNYHLAENTEYRYKVVNLNDSWQNNGRERSIKFNSLPPGNYGLEVAAINPDLDFKSDTIRLTLIVNPPWWRTSLAYLGYFLIVLVLMYITHKFLLNRKLETSEKKRLQELDTFKTNFFNNIAHELKTPLTIISGIARNLQKKGNKDYNKSVKTIINSSEEVNDLVNQLLDLSKLEVGKLRIDLVHGDIIPYLKYIMNSFESIASAKEIRLHFLSTVETLYMDFDSQKIKHIFSNLFSNAVKNTPVNGDIYLQIDCQDSNAQFIVKDNGIGISEKDTKFIFERYGQAKGQLAGTGIGLSFTKELIELMKGSISVESKLGKGSSFKVKLPIESNAEQNAFENIMPMSKSNHLESQPNLDGLIEGAPLIHIIEDNLDICSYLGLILKQEYQLNFSHNGENGLHNVIDTVPDLVITDLMMPIKNGFEVCQEIKSNPITDHIPVIMLTAKSDSESKLEGLKLGADAYLEKPFDERELLLQIANLLEQRETLQKKYRNPEYWENSATPDHKESNEFVLKIRELIEENIRDPKFGILELCRAFGISRSHLHRKLKALTDLSTSVFIQNVKLQKARQLLKTSEMNVSEVAYEVGFEDPAYFSRQFSKTFGFPPSETRKSL